MAYTMEDIRKSQEIFYYLLEKHELREEDEQALYKAYTEEEDIQNIVKSQAETASCDIERYGNTIYLIPQEENNFLGYSRVELKKELCKSTATNKDYYLAQFVILTLLTEFFDGDGNSSRAREYIRSGELMNILSERLREGAAYEEEHNEEEMDKQRCRDNRRMDKHSLRLHGITSSDRSGATQDTRSGAPRTI